MDDIRGHTIVLQMSLHTHRLEECASALDRLVDLLILAACAQAPDAFGILQEFGAFGLLPLCQDCGKDDSD